MVLALTTPNGQTGQVVVVETSCGPDVLCQIADVGGGGGGVALTTALFVDPATSVATPDQDGSAIAPFKTLAAAVAALPSTGGTLLCCPGSYPAESVDYDTKPLTLFGLGGPANQGSRLAAWADLSNINVQSAAAPLNLFNVMIGNVDLQLTPESAQPLVARGCSLVAACRCDRCDLADTQTGNLECVSTCTLQSVVVVGTINCAGEVLWNNSTVTGDIACENLIAYDCVLQGTITPSSVFDPLVFNNCQLQNINSPASVAVQSCTAGTITCAGLTARDSTISGVVTSTGELNGNNSSFLDAVTCTRVLRGADLIFSGQLTLTAAAFSHLENCQIAAIDMAPGSTAEIDQVTFAYGVCPTGGGVFTRFDLVPKQQSIGLDGSAPVNQAILPANHPAGLYLWSTYIEKTTGAAAGTMTCTLNYSTPTAGAVTLPRTAFSLVGTGRFSISGLGFETDGTAAISVDITFAGLSGTPAVNVFNTVSQQG